MAYNAPDMKAWRIQTGRTTNLVVPVSVLRDALDNSSLTWSVLREYLGLDLVKAIKQAPKQEAAS